MERKIIIAIDGPAGSGKTTTARITAGRLGYIYIDTGAMYRAVTLAWLKSGLELNDQNMLKILSSTSVELRNSGNGQRTLINGEDVSEAIRFPDVTKFVSPVSAMGCVREKLVDMQRELGKAGGVVLDGRDIGTVVFPNAELKVFLVASIEARARRRAAEMRTAGMEADEKEIGRQILERDNYDSSRELSPLTKAADAIEIDTSDITIDEQCDIVFRLARQVIDNFSRQ